MILLLSTSDTDLLAAQSCAADYRCANPSRVRAADVPAMLVDVNLVVVRLLGGRATWPQGLASVLGSGVPTVVLGGESSPDAELMAASTVPAGIAQEALSYLVEGGPQNLGQLAAFLSDTVLRTGGGFLAPVPMPQVGVRSGASLPGPDGRPESESSTTGRTSCPATRHSSMTWSPGSRPPAPNRCRSSAPRCVDWTAVTIRCSSSLTAAMRWSSRCSRPAAWCRLRRRPVVMKSAWSIGALAELDIPIMQGICLTTSRADWAAANSMTPMDAAMQVAIPEFDGRIITVPFSFKELGEDGLPRYVADPERVRRLAGMALRQARLRHVPAAAKRIGITLSSYPTKHARVGNAVGLDTPASAVRLLNALSASGVDVRRIRCPRTRTC